jgi:hypothetical protein
MSVMKRNPMAQKNSLLQPKRLTSFLANSTAAAAVLVVCGCGIQQQQTAPATVQGLALKGSIHGGQQPVVGAAIQLYAAGTAGYGSAAVPLLTTSVQSLQDGSFSITNDYVCPTASTPVYITATGGNPGLSTGTNNSALALMAALGPCGNLTSTTFISVNEVTTVAAVWSLAPFMLSYTNVGSSPSNTAGLVNAFAAVNKVVATSTGSLPGPALATGASLPIAEIDTLANILAACVNSGGGMAGDNNACGTLFSAATPAGGAAPLDTIGAALNIARNPATNVGALFNLNTATAPFQPSLSSAPANWLIGITYTGGGLSSPNALAIDGNGSVWVTNSNSVTKLDNSGTALSPSTGYTNGLSSPSGIAVDPSGNIWVANKGSDSVSKLGGNTGSLLANYTGGGLSQPTSLLFDAGGNVWITNFGNNSITELNSAGAALSPAGYTGAGISQPTAVAVNPRQ